MYGLLGVGVDRAYVLERWGSPVHYVRNHRDDGVVGSFAAARNLIAACARRGNGDAAAALAHVNYLGTFMKGMSQANTDDFLFLEEQEWRVVVTQEQIDVGRINETGLGLPRYRLILPPAELRLVVFPDACTRQLALQDPRVQKSLGSGGSLPLLTLEECRQF
jgi:hypothetical protein